MKTRFTGRLVSRKVLIAAACASMFGFVTMAEEAEPQGSLEEGQARFQLSIVALDPTKAARLLAEDEDRDKSLPTKVFAMIEEEEAAQIRQLTFEGARDGTHGVERGEWMSYTTVWSPDQNSVEPLENLTVESTDNYLVGTRVSVETAPHETEHLLECRIVLSHSLAPPRFETIQRGTYANGEPWTIETPIFFHLDLQTSSLLKNGLWKLAGVATRTIPEDERKTYLIFFRAEWK